MNSPWQQQYKGRNWTADKRPKSKKKPSFFLFRVFSIAPWRLSWLHALLRSFIGLYFHYTRSHILFYGQAARHTHKKRGKLTCYNGLWWPFDPIESISCDAETTTRFSNKESIGREFFRHCDGGSSERGVRFFSRLKAFHSRCPSPIHSSHIP